LLFSIKQRIFGIAGLGFCALVGLAATQASYLSTFAALAAMGLLVTATLTLARRLSSALVAMTSVLTALGEGNFDVPFPGLDRTDELGDLARAIAQFKLKAAEKGRAGAALEQQRHALAKTDALKQMAATVERETNVAVGAVAHGTERMAGSARLMSDSALMLEQNSGTVAVAAEQALANAQTVAEASAQMASSIAEIASQVTSSRALTLRAVTASGEAQSTIAKLSDAATKVGTVTSLINEIAGQTNLLALNATIEAARAGEAGRGFAVVASEVKSLAQQTAKATDEIAQQINEIQESTRASVTSISAIGEVIRSVESVSAVIASAVEEQSAVTSEISRTIEQTSQAAREVAEQIASVSRDAAETGRRASEIRDGSAEIASKVDDLRATLVRVIRTSTSGVDRRASSRIPIDRQGTLTVNGQRSMLTVRDLSTGGAMLEGAVGSLPINGSARLSIDGYSSEFAGYIARVDGATALLRFEMTAEQLRMFESLADRNVA
jgi:methyl-accepting chemotaxis protein